eukprot:4864532-Pyramimonas_sp.AAC.1
MLPPPADPVKNQCEVIAGRPRIIQMLVQSALCTVFARGPRRPCQKSMLSVRGAFVHDADLEAK